MLRKKFTTVGSSTHTSTGVYHNSAHGTSPLGSGSWTDPAYVGEFQIMEAPGPGYGQDNPCDNYRRTVDVNRGPWAFSTRDLGGGTHAYYPSVVAPQEWFGYMFSVSTNPHWGVSGTRYGALTGTPSLVRIKAGSSELPDLAWNMDAQNATSVECFPDFAPDTFIDNSLLQLLPRIRPELSLINSIYELKDFRNLPVLAKRLHSSFADISTNVMARVRGARSGGKLITGSRVEFFSTAKARRRATSDSLQKLFIELGTNGYLSYSFAIAPFISDCVAVIKAVRNVQRKVEDLLGNMEEKQLGHYSAPIPTLPEGVINDDSLLCWNAASSMNHRWFRTIETSHSRFTAGIEYIYMLTDWQIANAKLLGYLDAFGIGPKALPQIIWNMIPYTFLIDWVAGISRTLSKLNDGILAPKTNILRYCWSFKCRRLISLSFTPNVVPVGSGLGHTENGPYPIASIFEESYKRRPNVPDYSRSIRLSGLSSREFSLASALIASRAKKH